MGNFNTQAEYCLSAKLRGFDYIIGNLAHNHCADHMLCNITRSSTFTRFIIIQLKYKNKSNILLRKQFRGQGNINVHVIKTELWVCKHITNSSCGSEDDKRWYIMLIDSPINTTKIVAFVGDVLVDIDIQIDLLNVQVVLCIVDSCLL